MVPRYGHGVPAMAIALNTRGSWHSVATAATFNPNSFSVFANFNNSQCSSRR